MYKWIVALTRACMGYSRVHQKGLDSSASSLCRAEIGPDKHIISLAVVAQGLCVESFLGAKCRIETGRTDFHDLSEV